ncbi:MAG: hypothetical protein QXO01_07205 [Nitrososphaerota archaeon]
MIELEVVLKVSPENVDKTRDVLLKDDVVSRANVLFRDAKILEREGCYVRIIGTEEQCSKALELTRGVAEEVKGEEREAVLSKLKEEGDAALEGFGRIFG